MTINFFSKSETYREFSNFAPFPIELDGQSWPSAEHYYQAQKFTDAALQEKDPHGEEAGDRQKARADAQKQGARRLGRGQGRGDGACRAVQIRAAPGLRELLLSTGDEVLAEAAPNDYYWGVGADGTGQNRLGLLLMRIRSELRGEVP